MSGLPPPPASSVDSAAREAWIAELRALETPELLALCLGVHGSRERLRLYLSLFRIRMGARAQLASCLVCFDLARQGDDLAQREFVALAPTMAELARDPTLSRDLLAGDPYLVSTWDACREALAGADPRQDTPAFEVEAEAVSELDLLSEEDLDLGDILERHLGEQAQNDERAEAAYTALLAEHLSKDPETGVSMGFATSTGRELDRLEDFLRDVALYERQVPSAAGMLCLGQLFLATHLRSRTLFGRANPRRRTALREGLRSLPAQGAGPALAAAAFELAGGPVPLGFEKVLELLLDYLGFCHANAVLPGSEDAADAYVEAGREAPPVLLSPGAQRRRRS